MDETVQQHFAGFTSVLLVDLFLTNSVWKAE